MTYRHLHTHYQKRKMGALWGNESSIAIYVEPELQAPRFWLVTDNVEYTWSSPILNNEGEQVGLTTSPRVRAGIAFPNQISATAFINRVIDFAFGDNDELLRGRITRYLTTFGTYDSVPEELATDFTAIV